MEPKAVEETKAIEKTGFVRINALLWADILVAYALFVMQDYLTNVWKISFTHAAAILNFWGGISKMLPLSFLFLVDTILGNFKMLVISSIAYSVGIGLLTMSTPPVLANSTGTCKEYEPQCIGHTQKALFYTGMVLIAVGVAGNVVSLKPFRDDEQQKRPDNSTGIECLRIPGFMLVAVVAVTGAIALPYVKAWSLRFGIPAICTLVGTIIFLSGWTDYYKEKPEGSPITNVFRVFVAAASKMCKSFPLNARKFKKDGDDETFKPTRLLRCLEKAAIMSDNEDQNKNRWLLCSVAEVEEAKIALRMVPMWMTFIICGIVSSIGNTYFVEQASNMNRHVGKLKVPPQILLLVFESAKKSFATIANKLLQKESEETENDANTTTANKTSETGAAAIENTHKKIASAIGIGLGMIFSILCCITAAKIEQRRLRVVRRHGLLDKPDEEIPMNILWLVFQFILLAGLDSFLANSVAEFYKNQSPESMGKYLDYFTRGVSGLGFMFSALSVYVVGRISEKGGKNPNWFQDTLNKSRLDRYYWVLAALSSVNLIAFILVAWSYRYKDLEAPNQVADATGGGGDSAMTETMSASAVACCCCG